MNRVEPGLLARAFTRLEKVNARYTNLDQINAILKAVCEESEMKLKVLELPSNDSVRWVKPELLGRAVTRLEELNIINTDLTEEQISVLQEARSSCRVIGL